jgi:serine/threonine protein phosphatase 1
MSSRTIAIGDIHGCDLALARLLEDISPEPDDLIVTLGDYVDRGPNAPAVLDRLLQLQTECRLEPLLGNHEVMLLAALEDPSEFEFWLGAGGEPTLAAYGSDLGSIPAAHRRFLSICRPYVELDDFIFVHANYTPSLPLECQPEYVLYWEHLTAHLPGRHISGKTAIVGHTPQRNGRILRLDHLICIDTFCYGGGWLTALDVHSNKVWQADKDGESRRRACPRS